MASEAVDAFHRVISRLIDEFHTTQVEGIARAAERLTQLVQMVKVRAWHVHAARGQQNGLAR